MRYRARHTTRYAYEATVSQCQSEARLTPRALPWQTLVESRIQTTPEPASIARHKDYFGNEVTSFTIVEARPLHHGIAPLDVVERTAGGRRHRLEAVRDDRARRPITRGVESR